MYDDLRVVLKFVQTFLQTAVKHRFLDQSIQVREAALDIIGKYLVIKPDFINQYLPMITERLRDKGIMVRKKVVKILRDICMRQPTNPMTPKICVQLVSLINDEEAIKVIMHHYALTTTGFGVKNLSRSPLF